MKMNFLGCRAYAVCAGILMAVIQGCATAPEPETPDAVRPPQSSYRTSPDYPRPYYVLGKWYQPLAHARGFQQRGIASWYGEDFHGRLTSNGEIYDMNGVSAAHKILPLGTWVLVHNLENRRKLVLRINDRGPFVPGRIIDLSKAAAKRLGVYGKGTAYVEITALGSGPEPASPVRQAASAAPDYYQGGFSIQVGAFSDLANAESLAGELDRIYMNPRIKKTRSGRGVLYRVLVGQCTDLYQAGEYERRLKNSGFRDAFTVAE